jgi:hypothetical protein
VFLRGAAVAAGIGGPNPAHLPLMHLLLVVVVVEVVVVVWL